MFEWHKKEAPFFTGVTRGVGGFGFGKAAGPTVFSATGGTKTTDGSYTVHTFTFPNSQDFVVASGNKSVIAEILGGGGGGNSGNANWAAGGGGGGYAYASKDIGPGTYPITVGSGASRQSGCGGSGNSGSQSSAIGFIGGGGGGAGPGNNTAPPGPAGTYSIPGGTDLGSSNGQAGNGSTGDGSGGGGNNGKRVASPPFTSWGGGASGVNNGNPGPNAGGYGNGGAGGHSCQVGHNGGGAGSPGIVILKYLT